MNNFVSIECKFGTGNIILNRNHIKSIYYGYSERNNKYYFTCVMVAAPHDYDFYYNTQEERDYWLGKVLGNE